MTPPPIQRWGGLLEYKPQWSLSLKGWLVLWLAIAIGVGLTLNFLQSFLAAKHPIEAKLLVVEGWLPPEALETAQQTFDQNHYQWLITVGADFHPASAMAEYGSAANLASLTLKNMGFDHQKLITIATPRVQRNRTAATAQYLKQWLRQHHPEITSLNLYSYDVHSRRSWYIFQKVMGPEITVGILSYPSLDYDPKYWWLYSEGVRSVLSEAIAYGYAIFIWPWLGEA